MTRSRKLLFIQPIVSHYRKSVVREIIKLEPDSFFWGTGDFLGVEPLVNEPNVDNDFRTIRFKIRGVTIYWYKGLFRHFFSDNSTHVIISGINPLLPQTYLIAILARFFTKKKVYWWSQGKKFKQGVIGKRSRCFLYKHSDGVFLYSQQGKENFKNEDIPENKLHVVNNCLNYEDYGWLNYDLSKQTTRNGFRIIYTGRLAERKKVFILIKALHHLIDSGEANIYIDIIGDGDQRNELEKYVNDNDLGDFVSFKGALYGKNVDPYLLNADISVCPGAVGLSIVHSFSFGLPLLTALDDPAHSSELELLECDRNGGFFELDNHVDLANKILLWKERLKTGKLFYSQNCIDSVISHGYLPDLVAQNIIKNIR